MLPNFEKKTYEIYAAIKIYTKQLKNKEMSLNT